MLQVMFTVYLIPMLFLGTSIDSVILPKMTNYCKKECFKYRRLILLYISIYLIALLTTKKLRNV